MTGTGGASPAEQHLGDRLAALVDGELGHEARERVLAHLATCCKCKAEADAQRRLKSFFAETAPPPPSEGLLARLQGLPGGDPHRDGTFGGGPGLRGEPDGFGGGGGSGFPGRRSALSFGRFPGGRQDATALPAAAADGPAGDGFRIHDVGRRQPGSVAASPGGAAAGRLRPGSVQRGRRFAFAAAGAVSLAALALGGALPLEAAVESQNARRDGSVTPLRATPAGRSEVLAAPLGAQPSGTGGALGVAADPVPTPTAHPEPLRDSYAPRLPVDSVLAPLLRQVALQHGGAMGVPSLPGNPVSPAPTVLTAPSAPPAVPQPGATVITGSPGTPGATPPSPGR